MIDLSTTYLGLKLKNPLVASASPLSEKIGTIQELEKAGIAAVVLNSLFEEQIIHESLELDHFLSYGEDISAESPSHWPEQNKFLLAPDLYISNLAAIKKSVSIPVIGSLNGVSTGGWIKYARKMEDAGADAMELNLYYLPTSLSLKSSELEDAYVTLVSDVCRSIKIPVAVKLSPYFTSLPNVAQRLAESGAKGLVLFNRFYQPDIDLELLEVTPNLVLSNTHEMRLPLRWIAILHGKIPVDFALTSGIHDGDGVLKTMMVGARAAMLASELLQNGIGRVPAILAEVEKWMLDHEYDSIQQMQGSLSMQNVKESAAFERANYMKALKTFRKLP